MTRWRPLLWGSAIALALSVRFVFETALVNRLPGAVTVFATVVPAAIALVLVSLRLPRRAPFTRSDRIAAVAAGVVGVWLSPFLVATSRLTDAPSGSDVLFLTTAVWALLLVLGTALPPFRPAAGIPVAAALLGVTGAAGILANWERPSSFSPFIKFPRQETLFLLGGVALVAGIRLLAGLVRRHGPLIAARSVAVPGAAAAIVAALFVAPGRLADLAQVDVWVFAAPAALAAFVVLLGWAEGLSQQPPEALAAAYLLPPALVTGLSVVEQATGLHGPTPILWAPALAGIAVTIAAAAVVAVPRDGLAPVSRVRWAARLAAVAALLLAVVGLTQPDLIVSVTGVRSTGAAFRSVFPMDGAETLGGWLAFCCSLFVAFWAWSRDRRKWASVLYATLVVVGSLAWLPLHATPTHTWTTWIPPEVQQDYGTEFAQRTQRPVGGPWEPAALGVAFVSGALVLVDRRSSAGKAREGQEVPKA